MIRLYGGKGGVGKTTCAAATGLALDGEVLVVSTDPAHSLSDAFEVDVGPGPTEVESGLYAAEVDPETGTERYRTLFERLGDELSGAGIRLDDEALEDLFAAGATPGGDELAALDAIATHSGDDRWDHLVLDTAPTGHTLRLLAMPGTVSKGVETALSLRDQVKRKTDAAKTMFFGPYATSDADDDPFTEVMADMEAVRAVLTDPERARFHVVALPERMVLAETERLVERVRAARVPVGSLVLNRVLESVDEDCARCTAQRDRQRRVLADFEDRLGDLSWTQLPDLTGEADGYAVLERLAPRLA